MLRNLYRSAFGLPLRKLFTLIPDNLAAPIPLGHLRGHRWVINSSRKSCYLGIFEKQKQALLSQHLKAGDTFYDIGANVGFFTLLGAKYVGSQGHVYAFEPFPSAADALEHHVLINGYNNVDVYRVAVSDQPGSALFAEGDTWTTGKLSAGGTIEVKVVQLDQLIEGDNLPLPDVIKIDIEGAENLALRGAEKLIRTTKPLILLATHGDDVHRECELTLKDLGYHVEIVDSNPKDQLYELVAHNKKSDA